MFYIYIVVLEKLIMSLKQKINEMQVAVQRAQVYSSDLDSGKRSAATMLRKELQLLKAVATQARALALEQQKSIPVKSRSKKEVVEPEVVDEPEPVERQTTEPPVVKKRPLRKAK